MMVASAFAVIAFGNPVPESGQSDDIISRLEYYNERDQISFSSETTIGASVSDVNGIATGDVDNDGDLEIVTVSNNAVTLWRSTADPWQLWVSFTIGDFALETGTCVALADLDQDGWLDVVAVDSDCNVWCWQNDGTPYDGWPMPNRITTTSVLPQFALTDLVVVDLDNDGWLDVVTTDNSTDLVNVYMNKNDHTPFSGLWTGMADGYMSGWAATSIDAADIDLNGWPDLVVGHSSGVVLG